MSSSVSNVAKTKTKNKKSVKINIYFNFLEHQQFKNLFLAAKVNNERNKITVKIEAYKR